MDKANMRTFVHHLPFLIFLCFHLQRNIAATDSILQGQTISFPDSIISAGGVFELGFFSPGNSGNYYVGIWHKKVSQWSRRVVWIANRNHPSSNASGVLTIKDDGNLVIQDQQYFYKVTNTTSDGNTRTILMDSGNLVLKDSNSVILWQSFDYPSHAFLPGMKLGINKTSGHVWSMVSWKSSEDPGTGEFSWQMDANGSSQFFIMNGSQIYWTSGSWNGKIFSLVPEMHLNYIYNYSYINNESVSYFIYSLYQPSEITFNVMDVSGKIKQITWVESTKNWFEIWVQPRSLCDVYARCGSFAVCNSNTSTECECLDGFEPHSSEDWRLGDKSGGCLRKVPLQCEDTTAVNRDDEDKFLMMANMKYPADAQDFVVSSAKECNLICLRNCSCSAYAYNGSHGCSLWNGGLLNLQQLSVNNPLGELIYVKLAASKLPGSRGNKRLLLAIIPIVAFLPVVLLLGCYFRRQGRNNIKQKGKMEPGQNILLFDMSVSTTTINRDNFELPLFSFASVSTATDNFSAVNKLGEGGFGPVYKGKLLKGHEIAVKRLSKRSGQGLEELKTEAVLIAKLQHRNLVKLVGCCLEQEENIIIYEYMPNKSLDSFLFDPIKQGLLDWGTRVRIIEGIAQGLLYLHQYSRLRIIHRDLKASNILLDVDMNPKISDFGMARIFEGNELQANTNRIVGTYGYMSPEYALEGLFSVKSDVFSFGVLLLEIVSGKKNTGFYQTDSLNLLGYTWDLWKADLALELMDPVLKEDFSKLTLLRYINVALLCVQKIAADRPTMFEVVSMFNNEALQLPSPKQPAFSCSRSVAAQKSPMSKPKNCSTNDVTISLLEAR